MSPNTEPLFTSPAPGRQHARHPASAVPKWWRTSVLTTAGLLSACVLPDHTVSGLELSWQLSEGNEVDGEPDVVRSCLGGLVTDVRVQIDDLDDADRHASYAFTCDQGFRTSSELFVTLGEIYVDLHPGGYRVRSEAIDDPAKRGALGEPVVVASTDDDVHVSEGGPTLAHYAFVPEPVDLTLDVLGHESCQTLQARMVYANPEEALVEATDDGDIQTYRTALVSDRQLTLDDQPHLCEGLGGLHVFAGVDRGDYKLLVTLDGTRTCEAALLHDGRTGVFTLDLTQLGC